MAEARQGRGMSVADVDVAWAERDASPTRMRDYDTTDHLASTYTRIHAEREARSRTRSERSRASQERRREPVEEVEELDPIRSRDGPHGTPNETGSISSVSSVDRRESRASSGNARQRQMSTLSKSSTKMERAIMEYIDRHPTAVSRIEGHRLQHMQTVGSRKPPTGEGFELPDFGGGKEYPPPLPEREEYVVEFSGHDDPRHAQNFPFKTKLVIASILVFDSLAATFASSIFSAGSQAVGEECKCST